MPDLHRRVPNSRPVRQFAALPPKPRFCGFGQGIPDRNAGLVLTVLPCRATTTGSHQRSNAALAIHTAGRAR